MIPVNYYKKYELSSANTYEELKKEGILLEDIQKNLNQRRENEERNYTSEGHSKRLNDIKVALDKFATEASRDEYDKSLFQSTAKFLVDRGWMDLEDGDWKKGEERFEEALDSDPKYAPAYIGKLCVKLHIQKEGELAQYDETLIEYKAFQLAIEYASDEYRSTLIQYCPVAKTIPSRTQEAYPAKFLVDRGWMDLEDEDWEKGDKRFERALDIDSRYAPAYIGKLCVTLQIRKESDLTEHVEKNLTDYKAFENAMKAATDEYKATLEQYNQTVDMRREELNRTLLKGYNSKLEMARQSALVFFVIIQFSLLCFFIFGEIVNVQQDRFITGVIVLSIGGLFILRALLYYVGRRSDDRRWMVICFFPVNLGIVITTWSLWTGLVSHLETRRVWRGIWRGHGYVTERIYNIGGFGRFIMIMAIVATIFMTFEIIASCYEFVQKPTIEKYILKKKKRNLSGLHPKVL